MAPPAMPCRLIPHIAKIKHLCTTYRQFGIFPLVLTTVFAVALTIGMTPSAGAQSVQCSAQPDQAFGGVATSRVGNGVLFKTRGLAVDADGAPNSYRADGKGLSYTCDGVVGIVNGNRVTKKTDPRNWNRICNEKW